MTSATPSRALVAVPDDGYDVAPQPHAALTWSESDLQALKETVAKGCTDSQFKVFIIAAKRLGLDPFARQITPVVQGSGMTPQITIDGFRLIADRTKKYAGQLGPFWCGPDGEWKEMWLSDGAPAAAKVGVLRRDFDQPTWGVARFKSYNKGGNWDKMPDVMIAKVAEALALRKAFPQELSGVYSDDELGTTEPGATETPRQASQHRAQPQQAAPARRTVVDATPAMKWPDIRRKAFGGELGDMAAWQELVAQSTGKHDLRTLTDDDKAEVLAYLPEWLEARASAAASDYDLRDLDTGSAAV